MASYEAKELIKFFESFPITQSVIPKGIDREFFEKVNKYIQISKSEIQSNPPHLCVWDGLGLDRGELRHCKFISWLLDPAGSHSQGGRFFECLCQTLGLKEFISYAKSGYFTANTEENIKFGRVDILLKGKSFQVLIEAKIDAGLQHEQLTRYNKWLESQSRVLKIDKKSCKILFLTVDGYQEKNMDDASNIVNVKWSDISDACSRFASICEFDFLCYISKQYSEYIMKTFYK